MNKEELIKYIMESYGVDAEFPWQRYPDNIVFRHNNNKKWFALIMTVPKEKLGLSAGGSIDIMNVKCDMVTMDIMRTEQGIYPAYHMNKKNWISIALDGNISDEKMKMLIDISFRLTAPKIKKHKEAN